jgi:hypothetical protein
LDVIKGALPGVIQHESGGDPTAPHKASGTPRGGLIQITTGARLPGFTSSGDVWAVRDMSIQEQFEKVVVPHWKRFGNLSTWDLKTALRKNFLPVVASQPSAYVLGVQEGSTGPGGEQASDPVSAGTSLTRGAIYNANPGFDPGSKRGYFTWADVDADATRAETRTNGQWITVYGKIVSSSTVVPGPLVAGCPYEEPGST